MHYFPETDSETLFKEITYELYQLLQFPILLGYPEKTPYFLNHKNITLKEIYHLFITLPIQKILFNFWYSLYQKTS